MGSIFGKLGYGGIKTYNKAPDTEFPFDQVEDNITTHYNEQIKIEMRAAVTGKSKITPNGGLCNDVKQSG